MLHERVQRTGFLEELRETPRRLLVRRALAFGGAGGLLAYMGFEGAAYDIVTRQQIALSVWSLIALGLALGVFPRGTLGRPALVPLLGAAGLVAWMLLSFTWTESAERTTAEIARVLGYAGLITLALLGLNRHTFRAAAAGISVAAFAVIAVAVISRLSPSTFPDALEVAQRFTRADRLDFPLGYWNGVGLWGAMCMAVGLAWSAHARIAVLRALSLATVPVAGLAIYVSYSRGGVIAGAIAVVAVLALSRNRFTAFIHALAALGGLAIVVVVTRAQPEIADATGGEGGGTVALALAGAAALCAGAVFLTWVLRSDDARLPSGLPRPVLPIALCVLVVGAAVAGSGEISEAWDEFKTQEHALSTSDPAARLTTAGGKRNEVWNSALDAYREEPLTGIGPGAFEFWWQRDGSDPEYMRDAHSLYLEFLAELGIVGLVLLLTLLGGVLLLAIKGRQLVTEPGDVGASVAMIAPFIVFLVSAAVDWMWEMTAIGAFALAAGAIAAAGGSERLPGPERRGQLGRRGVRAGLVAAAIACAISQVPGLVSTQRLRGSEEAMRNGDTGVARELADDAVAAMPYSASAHAQLALVELTDGNLAEAEREIARSMGEEPTNWRWPLLRAPIEARRGDREEAIETFRNGQELAPELPFYDVFSGYGQAVFSVEQLEAIYARRQARAAAEDDSQ